jgi:hypothetical protein
LPSVTGTVEQQHVVLARTDRLVVMCCGPDETGTPAVAIWWLDLHGEPLAGWVHPMEELAGDPVIARRLLIAATGGLLVDSDPPTARRLIDWFAAVAGADRSELPTVSLDLSALIADVERRVGPTRVGTPQRRTVARWTPCPVVDDGVLRTSDLVRWYLPIWREHVLGGDLTDCGARSLPA